METVHFPSLSRENVKLFPVISLASNYQFISLLFKPWSCREWALTLGKMAIHIRDDLQDLNFRFLVEFGYRVWVFLGRASNLLMDTDAKDATNGCKTEKSETTDSQRVEENVNGDEDSESNSLLPPRRGGMSRKTNKTRRKVQWNDKNGNKLVEVLEFEPSDFVVSEFDLFEFSQRRVEVWSKEIEGIYQAFLGNVDGILKLIRPTCPTQHLT
ncbi:hypothetical protein Prudu_000315 [Prunus dulcis]|uniref:Uncharacterized protein n=1 Tax=Prunus dulcis TaxID=3755 RepID=A0A4Y1QL13_PRUDU|nr:hypothetical protein Prudu_000315 [Prunus dulcis]